MSVYSSSQAARWSSPHLIPTDIDGGTANREFVSTLYDVMLHTTAWDLEQRDAKVRNDVQRRQVKHAAKKTDKEDLRPGDDVGLKGRTHTDTTRSALVTQFYDATMRYAAKTER